MAIQDVKGALETIVKAQVDLHDVKLYPTNDQRNGYFADIVEETGRFEPRSSGWAQSFHSVAIYLLGSKTNMFETFNYFTGKPEAISAAILNAPTLSGTCDTMESIDYAIATVNIGAIDYIGYKITVNNIKMPRVL